MTGWKSASVTIRIGIPEIDRIGVFRAFIPDDTWNGFAAPYFTRDEGLRIAAWTEALKRHCPGTELERLGWNDSRQAFVIENLGAPHSFEIPEEDVVTGVMTPGFDDALFPIGAYRWTWEEAEED